jgi:predicted nuclease of restriction endonuclease-like (RecB) superfamily
MGWSRNVLLNQIKSNAYERHIACDKQNNFNKTLPVHFAEQANDAMKDVYLLDMLNITEPVLETELEQKMVQKIKAVMLELGYGFAFIGNQYRIVAEGREYFIDLLFYNRRLKSLVAIELKTGKFKPEYAGKMNFYLNLLNEYVREKDENPAIGIILCADKDNFEVDFALRDIAKPVGIAEYQLVRDLPKILEGKMPSATELEDKIRVGIAIDEKANE